MRKQITLGEILNATIDRVKNNMYHVNAGIVHAYNAAVQQADVQIAVNDVRFDPDTKERIPDPGGIIPGVPVLFPRSSGYAMAWPLVPGDKVVLVAFDLDPTKHRGTGNQEDPVDVSRHTGAYWVAFPGDITDPGKMKDAAAAGSAMVIGADGDSAQVRISPGSIQLGASAGDHVALASKVNSSINALATAINGWTPNAGDGGAALKTALTAWLSTWTSGSVASSLVKSG